MSKPSFRQIDVTRLIRGARAAGWAVGDYKITVENGVPTLLPIPPGERVAANEGGAVNEWDVVLHGRR